MKHFRIALLLAASALGACDGPVSTNHQPVTGNHPAPPAGATDTTRPDPAASRPVPFVNPTAAGHLPASPSPPGSRTH